MAVTAAGVKATGVVVAVFRTMPRVEPAGTAMAGTPPAVLPSPSAIAGAMKRRSRVGGSGSTGR